jgi:hypothetical protein
MFMYLRQNLIAVLHSLVTRTLRVIRLAQSLFHNLSRHTMDVATLIKENALLKQDMT